MRCAAPVPTASPPRRTARCSFLRLPAAISVISMSRLRCHRAGAARAAPRRTAHLRRQPRRVADHGAGTTAISSATTARLRIGLPGDGPHPYTVYVDESEVVWVND